MGCSRDCIDDIIKYLESLNIDVNIAKNKARGNKGFFSVKGKRYRIDVSKVLNETSVLSVLAHEFAHYVHYCYDKSLSSLDFIFEDFNNDILEELISVTVDLIPKDCIKPFFEKKESLKAEIKYLSNEISKSLEKKDYVNLEKQIKKTSLKYLLKYDNVKVFEGFQYKLYSIEDLDNDTVFHQYLKLKSKKRALNRINSKINRLNKYYNSLTELFARSFECYITNKSVLIGKAPIVYNCYEQMIKSNKIPMLTDFVKKL